MKSEYYQQKLNDGLLFQEHVRQKLFNRLCILLDYCGVEEQNSIGESLQGFEVKFDDMLHKTGNLWIEIAEKTNPNNEEYVSSGVFRKDNTWVYIIGDRKELFVFSKKLLKRFAESGKFEIRENNMKTSRGFLLNKNIAEAYCELKL